MTKGIAAVTGAHREFLDDTSAVLVPSKSIQEVANCICRTLDRPHEAGQRVAKSLKAIKDRTPLMTASKYIRLYKACWLTGVCSS